MSTGRFMLANDRFSNETRRLPGFQPVSIRIGTSVAENLACTAKIASLKTIGRQSVRLKWTQTLTFANRRFRMNSNIFAIGQFDAHFYRCITTKMFAASVLICGIAICNSNSLAQSLRPPVHSPRISANQVSPNNDLVPSSGVTGQQFPAAPSNAPSQRPSYQPIYRSQISNDGFQHESGQYKESNASPGQEQYVTVAQRSGIQSGAANQQRLDEALPDQDSRTPSAEHSSSQSPGRSLNERSSLQFFEVNIDTVNARLQQVNSEQDTDETIKQQLIELYEKTIAELNLVNDSLRVATELREQAQLAPQSIDTAQRNKSEIAKSTGPFAMPIEQLSIDQLQEELATKQTELNAVSEKRGQRQQLSTSRETRKPELTKLIAEEKDKLEKLEAEIPTAGSTVENDRLKEAIRWQKTALRNSSVAKLSKLNAELELIDAESKLIPLELEILSSRTQILEERILKLTSEFAARRESDILKFRTRIESLNASTPDSLTPYIEHLRTRIDTWLELSREGTSLQKQIDQTKSQDEFWTNRYAAMSAKLESTDSTNRPPGGLNSLIGLMLRRHKSELPNVRRLKTELQSYQDKMVETQALILELNDIETQATSYAQKKISEREFLGTFVSGVPNQLNTAESAAFRNLLQQHQQLVADYRSDANAYSERLLKLATAKQSMIQKVTQYSEFIDEHVLWIRSSARFSTQDFETIAPALQWFLSFDNWRELGRILLVDSVKNPVRSGALFIGWVLLLLNSSRLRKRMMSIADKSGKSTELQYRSTIHSLLLGALVAAPWPILLAAVGYRLVVNSDLQTFPYAIGCGLLIMGRYCFVLEYFRQLNRKNGVAERLFNWSTATTRLIAQSLRWLIDLGVPLAGVTAVFANYSNESWESSIGRISFTLLMLCCSAFVFQTTRPRKGVFASYLGNNRGGWADRLRHVWFSVAFVSPVGLATLSLIGYHFTAVRIASLAYTTLATLGSISIAYYALCRWSDINQRRIQVEKAKGRLAVANSTNDSAESFSIPQVNEGEDLDSFNAQTVRLIRSALFVLALVSMFYIWQNILPAVNVLESFALDFGDETNKISLAQIVIALPITVMTFIAARNLPGLIEIALLQYLPIENAVRYAITTLSRYTIMAIGLAIALVAIGIKWSSIQWLIAALGVGLGFGLQEIFANFVSGIILLFEQPIRVGDVITLGDVTGTVSRIRMRATTITNWDRQELIIPNKDLITGRLLNWTLTDATNRLVLTVGISYDDDTQKACNLLLNICKEHENVLIDPGPSAYFENFGDSTLDITVRLFLSRLDQRLTTRHELMTTIKKQFDAEEIEIAFPQRDINIRSIPEQIMPTTTKAA